MTDAVEPGAASGPDAAPGDDSVPRVEARTTIRVGPGPDDYLTWASYGGRDVAEAADVDAAQLAALDDDARDEADDATLTRALQRTDLKAAEQANKLRKRFFTFVMRTVATTLIATAVIMAAYVVSQWGKIEAAVMVAFFSAVVVQVIGLALIIARYLFAPRGNGNGNGAPAK